MLSNGNTRPYQRKTGAAVSLHVEGWADLREAAKREREASLPARLMQWIHRLSRRRKIMLILAFLILVIWINQLDSIRQAGFSISAPAVVKWLRRPKQYIPLRQAMDERDLVSKLDVHPSSHEFKSWESLRKYNEHVRSAC